MAWDAELRILNDAIRTAGTEIKRLASDGFDIQIKPDRSPVTSADLAVNRILQSRLLGMFPGDGWLSEESPDGPARLSKTRVWVIDPIDGTRAFIHGEPEFCISVALLEENRPVVAAIFNPSTNELFTATRGGGLHLNHEPLTRQNKGMDRLPIIALSPWGQPVERFKGVEAYATSRPMRSIAWALALTAGERIHAVLTFEPENEWDVAAGALLIEEAGGTLQDGEGQALRFNRPEPRFRGIIATSRHCPDPVRQQLRALSRTLK